MSRLGVAICHRLSLRKVLSRRSGDAGANPSTFDESEYTRWRTAQLAEQFAEFIDPKELHGLDVLDFGCGFGDLCFHLAAHPLKSLHGVDVNARLIEKAKARLAGESGFATTPSFALAETTDTIDRPSESQDAILCFDVLEHIMDYRSIIPEWMRVLRPGGSIYIWWVPWWHPFGPHIESLVPIPWAHVFFSDRTLIETCARIYDHPEFKARVWDQDEDRKKKPNKWLQMESLPGVNRLSIAAFEKLARQCGFQITQRRVRGFGSSGIKRASALLTKLPIAREFFTASVTYRLTKP